MSFEHPGSVVDWANEKNYTITYTKIFKDANFPSTDSFDMLVIMGGVMGAYEEDKYEWMRAEKLFIKKSIEANKKVLGICLGAQFIADALGAKVFPHTKKEIGWFEVEKVATHKLTENLPQTFTTFHWHGDTFTLPGNAIHLCKTQACEQQGFVYNNHVAGLQFHTEIKEDLLNSMIENERSELIKAKYVQTEDKIKRLATEYIGEQKKFMHDFLEAFIKL
jgi:GMP synthase-like glutamine amidotransferase